MQPERYLLRLQIAEHIPPDIESCLDIGGGDGKRYRQLFEHRGIKYQSLDINPDLMPDIVSSAESLPFDNGKIEFILSSQMLEHVLNPLECLKEIFRVLKPGGYLLITVPQTNELHSEPFDFWRFTNFGMIHLLETVGFQIQASTSRGNYPIVICQMRIRRWIDSFNPYQNSKFLLFLYPISRLYLKISLRLDNIYTGRASQKHTLGWTFLAKKLD